MIFDSDYLIYKKLELMSTFSWFLERRAMDTNSKIVGIVVPTFVYLNYWIFFSSR